TKGKEPHAPKDFVDRNSLAVQSNKQISQCVALRFIEDRKEIRAAEESQRGNIVERVEKTDRRRNQNESHHVRSPGFVHVAEHPIKRDAETDEYYLSNEIAEDRRSKHRLVRQNVVGGGGGVFAHEQFVRKVYEGRGRWENQRQMNKSGAAG